ncbi:MAG TPA: hypothetical protein DCY40_01385 [Actinobacteria bacterium]|nr:hypothetical protein [Actinomycetota bacterium]
MTFDRLLAIGLLAAAVVVATAPPALADPAVPTHYRSVVTELDPAVEGMTIDVAGGDAFLVVAVAPGHHLDVPGYFAEPYLRIDADGTVWRNHHSPSRFINESRYGVEIPVEADPVAEADWRAVGNGGTYAWHDHRTHWMSRDLPPTIAGDRVQLVFPWELEVVLDGEPVTVRGELVWLPAVNPVGPMLIGLGGLIPIAWWRRGRNTLLAVCLGALGAAALLVATMQYLSTPVDRAFPSEMILPAVSVVLAIAAVGWRSSPIRATAARLLAAIALVIWGLSSRDVLTAPVLPSALPAVVERSLVALVLETALVLAALIVVERVRAERPVDRRRPTPA